MLRAVGTPAQHQRYLLPMIEGEVFGTMNLSETQAGSSLGDITTKAVRKKDGSYSISGQKMWISGGDHDLSDNIFHMVLAKIRPENADEAEEAGVKGISLFIVPKFRLPHQEGAGKRNGVALTGLNHKMGMFVCLYHNINYVSCIYFDFTLSIIIHIYYFHTALRAIP
jgi:alkylation response protein AidB-like acyl-CoA dehydrogenase